VNPTLAFSLPNNRYTAYPDFRMCKPEDAFLSLVIDPDLLRRIDDWSYKQRFPTREAAIKWLLEWALRQKPAPKGSNGSMRKSP
jgi:hypothetical protein